MSTGRYTFKHSDAARLIRAVEAAGKKVRAVTLKDGKLTVLTEGDAGSGNARNEWDDELLHGAHQAETR